VLNNKVRLDKVDIQIPPRSGTLSLP